MQQIPLQAVPNQTLQVQLADQACTINVYQLAYGLFFDLRVNADEPIVSGAICENLNRLVRYAYLGFVGDLVFLDVGGAEDPVYTGLNTRFLLLYLDPGEVAAAQET